MAPVTNIRYEDSWSQPELLFKDSFILQSSSLVEQVLFLFCKWGRTVQKQPVGVILHPHGRISYQHSMFLQYTYQIYIYMLFRHSKILFLFPTLWKFHPCVCSEVMLLQERGGGWGPFLKLAPVSWIAIIYSLKLHLVPVSHHFLTIQVSNMWWICQTRAYIALVELVVKWVVKSYFDKS